MLPGNAEAIQAWNTILFDKWVRFRHLIVDSLAAHGLRAMDLLAPRGAVVDIGCGLGDTTVELAKRVGPNGRAVGVDAAERFIVEARKDAAGVPNASFEVLDVEEAVTGGPFDFAFSRFGTMFFNQPVFALRNIRKALVPGGKLGMVVWRKKDANAGFIEAETAVREILGDPPKGDAITCGPGPFSMASPDLVSDQLIAAGWRDVQFLRVDAPLSIGRDVDDAVEFAMSIGPAGEVVRLAGQLGIDKKAECIAAVGKAMARYAQPGGVLAPTSVWIVMATNPPN
jgi:SAM-dependent methyltransferase